MNAEVTDEVIAEMLIAIKVEQASWKRRNTVQDRLGYCQMEAERKRRYYKPNKPNRPKWMRRKLNNVETDTLSRAWI